MMISARGMYDRTKLMRHVLRTVDVKDDLPGMNQHWASFTKLELKCVQSRVSIRAVRILVII